MRTFQIPASACGIPAGAGAYSLNLTVVPQGHLAGLTAWQSGQPRPSTSNVISMDGSIVANGAIIPAASDGGISVFATDTTNVVIDINGYYSLPGAGGLDYYSVNQCRVVDTRNGSAPFGGPILAGSTPRTFPITASPCALPIGASAYAVNVTVVPVGPLGFFAAWPANQPQPLVSTLNDPKAIPLANNAVVPAGTAGGITVMSTSNTHVILDAVGYFAP
jgi:hypothetical protein